MATPYQNRLYGHAWFRALANTTINLADASVNTSLETVSSLNISQIFYGGDWTVSRGNNVILTLPAGGTTHLNFAGHGTTLSEYNTLPITLTTSSNAAYIIVQVNKESFANGTVI